MDKKASNFRNVENAFKDLNNICNRLYDTITLLEMPIHMWTL